MIYWLFGNVMEAFVIIFMVNGIIRKEEIID